MTPPLSARRTRGSVRLAPAPVNTSVALLAAWERAEAVAAFGSGATPEPYPGAWRERADAAREGWIVQLVREGRAELCNE